MDIINVAPNAADILFVLYAAPTMEQLGVHAAATNEDIERVAKIALGVTKRLAAIPQYVRVVDALRTAPPMVHNYDTSLFDDMMSKTIATIGDAFARSPRLFQGVWNQTNLELAHRDETTIRQIYNSGAQNDGDPTGRLFSDESDADYARLAADILDVHSSPTLVGKNHAEWPSTVRRLLEKMLLDDDASNGGRHRSTIRKAFRDFVAIYKTLIESVSQKNSKAFMALTAYNDVSPAIRLVVSQESWQNTETLGGGIDTTINGFEGGYKELFGTIKDALAAQHRIAPNRLRVSEMPVVKSVKDKITIS